MDHNMPYKSCCSFSINLRFLKIKALFSAHFGAYHMADILPRDYDAVISFL